MKPTLAIAIAVIVNTAFPGLGKTNFSKKDGCKD